MKDFSRALRYFRPDAGRIAAVFCLMLASAGLNALKPWPLAVIVDSASKDSAGIKYYSHIHFLGRGLFSRP